MIEVKHLKTLQALRNCGSLAAAAATLHQTQSALSHQFSDLEQRLGFRLFVRKSQPLRFTPQGEILLQRRLRIKRYARFKIHLHLRPVLMEIF